MCAPRLIPTFPPSSDALCVLSGGGLGCGIRRSQERYREVPRPSCSLRGSHACCDPIRHHVTMRTEGTGSLDPIDTAPDSALTFSAHAAGRPPSTAPPVQRLLGSGDEAGTAPEDRAFRPDIQGMRAVAVLLVVFSHVGIPGMADGIVGVDVFFVISGFVITGLLLRERAATGHTGIVAFYGRRARRIIPMATLVIVVVVIVDRIVDGATLGNVVAINGRWDAMFQGNSGYLQGVMHDVYTGPPPPQQLGGLAGHWSLAVEEQFYLVFPALFVLVAMWNVRWSVRSRLGVLLAVVIISSFAYALSVNPLDAYVSTIARAWEFAVGGLWR